MRRLRLGLVIALLVPATALGQEKSYSDEQCPLKDWALTGLIREVTGPCYLRHRLSDPAPSFMREGFVLRARLMYDWWKDVTLHFAPAGCTFYQRGTAVCSVTALERAGTPIPQRSDWYWRGVVVQGGDGRYEIVDPKLGINPWINFITRSKAVDPVYGPYKMPPHTAAYIKAMPNGPFPEPLKATGR